MPKTDAQKRATAKYDKANMKRATVVFSPHELDIYEHAKGHESISGYIKQLIRADMEGRILPR